MAAETKYEKDEKRTGKRAVPSEGGDESGIKKAKSLSQGLIDACRDGSILMVEKLLKDGADPDTTDGSDPEGEFPTALMVTICAMGREEKEKNKRYQTIVGLLLEYKADINKQTLKSNKSALMYAYSCGYEGSDDDIIREVIKTLLSKNPDLDLQDSDGKTVLLQVLELASSSVVLRQVEQLVGSGANLAAADHDKWSVLMRACNRRNRELVKFLLGYSTCVATIDHLSVGLDWQNTAIYWSTFEAAVENEMLAVLLDPPGSCIRVRIKKGSEIKRDKVILLPAEYQTIFARHNFQMGKQEIDEGNIKIWKPILAYISEELNYKPHAQTALAKAVLRAEKDRDNEEDDEEDDEIRDDLEAEEAWGSIITLLVEKGAKILTYGEKLLRAYCTDNITIVQALMAGESNVIAQKWLEYVARREALKVHLDSLMLLDSCTFTHIFEIVCGYIKKPLPIPADPNKYEWNDAEEDSAEEKNTNSDLVNLPVQPQTTPSLGLEEDVPSVQRPASLLSITSPMPLVDYRNFSRTPAVSPTTASALQSIIQTRPSSPPLTPLPLPQDGIEGVSRSQESSSVSSPVVNAAVTRGLFPLPSASSVPIATSATNNHDPRRS